jgi:hypothetical protein
MRIIAIDPGKTGAIAEYLPYRKEGKIWVQDMPKNGKEIADVIHCDGIAYIEHIQARENDKLHVSSAMKLMKNYGTCLGACYAYDMHVKIVTPAVWMSGFVQAGLDYSKRKTELHKVAKKFFPGLKIKKTQADALCLLRYAMAKEGVKYNG